MVLALIVATSAADSQAVEIGLPVTVALAAVALIGYMFGQRTRSAQTSGSDERRQQELDRAAGIARQLEAIADTLRRDLVAHHAEIAQFKRRLREVKDDGDEKSWERLCLEAEAMLGPTMQLAQQISHAYDQIRQQSEALETFARGRTDPLTGAGNGRALDQQLRILLGAGQRRGAEFTVALVSLDRNATAPSDGALDVLPLLPSMANVIRTCMRDSDFVARYGNDEFVVVMPQTTLAGARVFGDRLRKRAADELRVTVCCGLAESKPGDEARSLMARADSALYSAKAAGPGRVFVHTGSQIREHHGATAATAVEAHAAAAGQNGVHTASKEGDRGDLRAAAGDAAKEELAAGVEG